MSEENLSILINFIKENNPNYKEISHNGLLEEEAVYYFLNNVSFINDIVNVACDTNKRINSEEISTVIEEVCSEWEIQS